MSPKTVNQLQQCEELPPPPGVCCAPLLLVVDDHTIRQRPRCHMREMKPWLRATLIAALWVALNITLNLVNKHLFDVKVCVPLQPSPPREEGQLTCFCIFVVCICDAQHFKFPVFIIIFGTCCSFLGTLVLYLLHSGVRESISWHQIKSHWKLLLFVSIVHGLVSAFGNMSIVYIRLTICFFFSLVCVCFISPPPPPANLL